MKRLSIFMIAVFCCISSAFSQEGDPSSYTLIWYDEFNESGAPNSTWWDQPEYNRRNNDNGPDGYWKKEDAFLDGQGSLAIRVRKIDNQNGDSDPYDYSTGVVRTKDKFTHKYGRYEMRAKLPNQPGWWIAFWMMQGNVGSTANQGIDGSEVDIMEGWGWNEKINHAIHWDGYGDAHKSVGEKVEIPGLSEGYHIYTLDWHPNKYVFYIDGVETWRTEGGGVCTEPGYIKITGELSTESWAITEYWANNPEDAVYPDTFLVDYVRVYDFPEGRRSYFSSPAEIPGIIEAENYDLGEAGVVYQDASSDNAGNVYRVGDVDIDVCPEGGFALIKTEDSEWLDYSVNITGTGLYTLEIRASNPSGEGRVRLDMNGEALTDNIELAESSSFQEYTSTIIENLTLSDGEQLLRLNILSGNMNINYLKLTRNNIVFSLDGLEDERSLALDVERDISIEASSLQGEISSIGFFLNNDSIAGSSSSTLDFSLTPTIEKAGWNDVLIRIYDLEGNFYEHHMIVFFGDMPPVVKINQLPSDTLVVGENITLTFSVTDQEGSIDSVKFHLNNNIQKYINQDGLFAIALDTLKTGSYQARVEAWDNNKNHSADTLDFEIVLPPNVPPTVQILYPQEKEVLYTHAGNFMQIMYEDRDGTISSIEVSADGTSINDRATGSNVYDIDHLLPGEHILTVRVTDDRDGQASDTVNVIAADSVTTIDNWTLYQRGGSLSYLTLSNDTLVVDVKEATGNRSDIQLMKMIDLPVGQILSNFTISFEALSSTYSYMNLCLKNNLFSEDTIISANYRITPVLDSFSLEECPVFDPAYLSFYLGYRKGTRITITDLTLDFLTSNVVKNQLSINHIYPNPTTGIAYFKEMTTYSLYSMKGELLKSQEDADSIDISELENGIYFLKTCKGYTKLIKQDNTY